MTDEKKFGAVVAAAGSSSRMGGGGSKLLLKLAGETVLRRSLKALCACPMIAEIVVACRAEDFAAMRADADGLPLPIRFTEGGADRQESVAKGAAALSPDLEYLLVHDGARPLADPALIGRVCEDALRWGAATAAVPEKNTCKLSEDGFVASTLPRERLWSVQTPQAFRRALYEEALRRAEEEGRRCTDDCGLLEAAGFPVRLTLGDYRNIKITTPEDSAAARAMLKEETGMMRVGQGYDVHRLTEGRRLILGGVEIPFEKGLLGHSDADVLTHAICDALLGAAALGDLGHFFPDTDPRWEGADSLELLREVCGRVRTAGYEVENIDATLIAQRPKIAPYLPIMRGKLAAAAGLGKERISVKATTEEKLGFTGREEGMAAQAVCLLCKR